MKILSTLIMGIMSLSLLADTAKSPYGVCAHICKEEQWKLAEPKFQVLKAGGIRWVRNGFTWAQAEPEEGHWDYSKLDIVAETAKKYDIDILPILAYDVPWAHPAHQHLDQWREYVRLTVSRYSKQFRYWEVWNEANISESRIRDSLLSPEDYTKILRAAYEEIKKIDPEIQVLFTGTAGVPVPYIESCLNAGATKYFDIMNIHPYAMDTYPEKTAVQVDPLLALFKKHEINKPIWVTEFSWPTHSPQQPMSADVLKKALKILNITPENITLAIIRNKDLEEGKGIAFAPKDYTVNIFPNRREISYADLKGLDVEKYPVLVPSLTQAFPHKYFNEIVDYVRRGGFIIHSHGLPLYCDAVQDESGRWRQINEPRPNNEAMIKELHIKWLSEWRDKVPKNGKIKAAPGSGLPEFNNMEGGGRYISDANLQGNDKLIPFYLQENKDFSAPVVGLYKFDSDLKGAMLLDVTFIKNGVSQEVQGKFLPRAYLYFFSAGIDKVFWYKFRAEEYFPSNIGHHFGIVHRDYSPRDAFTAYKFLIKMLPESSSRPLMKKDGDLYFATWKRPDSVNVHAYWTVYGEQSVKIPFAISEAYDYLGRKVEVKDNRINASEGIIYLLEK